MVDQILSAPEKHDLASIEILADLDENQRRDFEKSSRWRRFASDEQIIDQQSDSRDVYFIASGRVRVVNFTLSGKEVALEDLGAGQYFGELAAIDGRPRSSTVVALEDSDIAKMSPERFLAVMKMYPDVALKVMANLAAVIRTSTDRIVDLTTLGANNRVHGELLRQAASSATDDNTATIKPIPVHSDMASRASTTRETVARVLSDLAKKGIVKREKDSLVICDVMALEDMVDEVRG
ncbi:MAG: Crp/Fnr family transcriptional regulator [Rhodospirillaceae bacterium]|nr:Crp/Fnr family transcriptional regulator [Rhodospirillaceae bacterium]MBT5939603.1 Crp/Fnr family transcriptional regulator [Rhodospirillaceae bacterium]MBT7957445.1 Crp/Fnr family transcriptional regulator [Rhodospirillaceae bacterium]